MKSKLFQSWQVRLALATLVIVVGLVLVAYAPLSIVLGSNEHGHMTTDWSHHHVVYSTPKTLLQGFKYSQSPRYVQQWVRRHTAHQEEPRDKRWDRDRGRKQDTTPAGSLKGDWAVFLGNTAQQAAGTYPAKYSFDPTTASCTKDFVVYATGVTGSSAGNPSQAEFAVTGLTTTGDTITIHDGVTGANLTITAAAATAATGPGTATFATNATPLTEATNIANAINLAAPTSTPAADFTAATLVNASGTLVVITETVAGTAGQSGFLGGTVFGDPSGGITPLVNGGFFNGTPHTASIAAYNSIYAGCPPEIISGVPSPSGIFAINTGGNIHTSVTLSGDGTQVAFVQSIAGVANLTILKWAVGPSSYEGLYGAVNATPTTAAAYPTCVPTPTAPCMVNLPFSGAAVDDTYSSPFYDFAPGSDTMYVGDDNDHLHKFTGIFKGTPAEVTTAPWPAVVGGLADGLVGNTYQTTSPVYDEGTGRVFILDKGIGGGGGFVSAVNATSGAVFVASYSSNSGYSDAPLLDPINETLYAFNSESGGSANASVQQFAAAFANGDAPVQEVLIGTGSETIPSYAGTFDNLYYTGGAGNLYACGNAGGSPTLYQIAVTAVGNLAATSTAGPALTSGADASTACSPISEIYNPSAVPATDWLFVSVTDLSQTATPINCPVTTGCIMSFNVTAGAAISGATTTVSTAAALGGTSGIVFDNVIVPDGTLITSGTSQVYYTPLTPTNQCLTYSQGYGGCAIQASQSALR